MCKRFSISQFVKIAGREKTRHRDRIDQFQPDVVTIGVQQWKPVGGLKKQKQQKKK